MTDNEKAATYMSQRRFDSLAEYSTTLPTGTFLRKLWKRHIWEPARPGGNIINGDYRWTDRWWLGEYVHCSMPGQVGIKWREIVIWPDANGRG
jgi:hypothetical protein